MSEWISIKELLPDESSHPDYLVLTEDGDIYRVFFWHEMGEGLEWFNYGKGAGDGVGFVHGVTHWKLQPTEDD